MITRTTSTALMRSAQQNLQGVLGDLGEMRERATTLKRIGAPSDDPIGTANSLLVRAEQRANEQYKRNISDGLGWLTTVDSTLTNVNDLIGRVRDLTVQGANDGAMSPTAKEAIAVELESLRADLFSQANTSYLGRSIFAGNSDAGVAFQEDPDGDSVADYAFTGVAGSTVERRIDAETTVRVDADGDAIFGSGAASVFALIDNIVSDLRSGTNIGPRLTELDARLETIKGHQATVGTRHSQVMRAEETNLSQSIALETQRSGIEDLDLAKAVLDLQMQEVSYQSALAVTARVLQPTLMDFLR
ncbi:flagellar hook-associated protein FlgL [Salinibacterium sp. SYSU T00001]|uniref:flagellar hook-associated protein FlgL n=1 Tax=Homoserinimonas sedimenticola TaxID=2986805 RepID=UPI002235D03E|nr:flagellar hook-associated protein FlgL [Salinibacterium sedimenticola]MCW4385746.1 flagellar hook-associated protein FlgL [Salinibacterium sedimenticola]